MNNDESKKSKSMVAKILGGIGVVVFIVYNGWVVYNNHFGSGSVKGTVKDLVIENIPNYINEDVVKFVELDDVKLDGIADDKWDGEAMAKLKAKDTGKIASVRFTFGVEKKGTMVYVNDLKLDVKSAEGLFADEASNSTDEHPPKGANKSKVTKWASYVEKLNADADQMTEIQKKELCAAECGRPVEIDVVVDDVSEMSEDGETFYVIQSHLELQGQDRSTIYIYVFNAENSSVVFEKTKMLTKNTRICVVGAVFFLDVPPVFIDPRIICLQIRDSDGDCSSLDQ